MRKLLKPVALGLVLALSACANLENSNITNKNAIKSTVDNNYLTRPVQDDIFYFVLPDRFYNGDSSNDNGSKTIKISQGGFNLEHMGSYHGGDIAGLEQKLDYIQNMGVTAIWLTPILRNRAIQNDIAGYHGYWVLDFTQIDPHLGSNDDLKSFIASAHAKGIKVFFDIITNHTADVIKYQQCHGEDASGWSSKHNLCPYKSLKQIAAGDTYTPVIATGEENIKVPAWLNDPKYYHNQGDSTFEGENSVNGDFAGLDDIDTNNPEVVANMIDIFKNIVDKFKPDGFRIDTVKHVNIEFWQQFSPAIVTHAKSIGIPNFFMFAEVYDGNTDVLSRYTTEGNIPSVLDFSFQKASYDAIAANKGTKPLETLFANDYKYNDHDSSANDLLNFIGNHDMGRFGHFLSNPEFNYSEHQMLKRSQLAHALMYFARGIPVIYYGDEQGFTGTAGDHLSRQDMMPSKVPEYIIDNTIGSDKTPAADNFDTNHVLYQAFKTYGQIYAAHKGLRRGEHQTIYADENPGIYAFSRTLDNETYYGVFNTAESEKSVTIEGNLELIYTSGTSNAHSGKVKVSGVDFAIYRKK